MSAPLMTMCRCIATVQSCPIHHTTMIELAKEQERAKFKEYTYEIECPKCGATGITRSQKYHYRGGSRRAGKKCTTQPVEVVLYRRVE